MSNRCFKCGPHWNFQFYPRVLTLSLVFVFLRLGTWEMFVVFPHSSIIVWEHRYSWGFGGRVSQRLIVCCPVLWLAICIVSFLLPGKYPDKNRLGREGFVWLTTVDCRPSLWAADSHSCSQEQRGEHRASARVQASLFTYAVQDLNPGIDATKKGWFSHLS